jgi:thiol:disulfide interchange protein DsbD
MKTRLFALLAFCALLFLLAAPATAFPGGENAQKPEQNVAIRLLPQKTDVKPGETITVGIEQKIREGWHTYWLNPGDSGAIPRIAWSGVDAIASGPIEWPLPKRLPFGPLMNYGYEDEVVLLQDITLPETLPPGAQTVSAVIDILVCADICIPETHEASFVINGPAEGVPAAIETARTKLPLAMGWQTELSEKDGNLIVRIASDAPGAFANLESVELFPEEWGLIANPPATKAVIEGDILVLSHPRGERALSDIPVSNIVIAYENQNGERRGVRTSALAAPAASDIPLMPPEKEFGLVQALLFAFLGGIILNLMPCVFPVLSMKALSLVKLQDKEESKARLHGLVYTLGILAAFAVIAGLLLAFKAAGAQIGWGFQLQHPAVILFLSYLFLLMGLNLAGYFEFSARLAGAGQSLTQKTGMTGTFFTGVLATIVATPCTAPFMGAAMGFALTQSAGIAMAVFLALGLGLAFPYLALCFIPAARRVLPRPGAWMEHFRQFLSFFMFAAAAWLFAVLIQQTDFMQQMNALLGGVAIALGLWFMKHKPDGTQWRRVFLALAALSFFYAASNLFMEERAANQASKAAGEQTSFSEPFTRARLTELLEGNDPVFVNMTADWCITCKVNEKVALYPESTRALFAENSVHYLKGDWTNQNPEITNFLEEYGRSGVPLYVYYGPRDAESGARPDSVLLPQLLTPAIVEKTILNAKKP